MFGKKAKISLRRECGNKRAGKNALSQPGLLSGGYRYPKYF